MFEREVIAMYCPNCKRQVPDGTKFCGGCGTPIHITPVRTAPPAEPETQISQAAPEVPVVTEAPVTPGSAGVTESKVDVIGKLREFWGAVVGKVPAKYLKIGGAVLAALLLIILAASLFGGSDGGDYAVYIKDEQLFFNDFSKNAPYEVTRDLYDGLDNSSLAKMTYSIGGSVCVTEDGQGLFYLDKLDANSGTLYYRNTGKMSKDPVKLASGVSKYSVSADGKTVTFLKGTTLYQHNLKDDTKIARDVVNYTVSDDGKIIYYNDADSVTYVYYKGDSEKVAADVVTLDYSEDMKTLFFLDEDTLYKKTLGKDKVKLATDVSKAFAFTDDGTFYYVEEMAEPLGSFFKAEEGYEDWIEDLNNETFSSYSLYYFDGKTASVICESCDYTIYSDNVCYTTYDTDISKISTDTLKERYYNSYYTLAETANQLVSEAMQENGTVCLSINGKTAEISLDNVEALRLSPDGKLVYALCDVDPETNEGDLYKASVSGGKVGTFTEVDDGVSCEYGYRFADSEGSDWFVYFKGVEEGEGELCVDGKSVADDVYVRYVSYNSGKDGLIFYTDYDSEDFTGTLNIFDGKKVTEISDDVWNFDVCDNGNIVFLTDYRYEKEKGTLNIYDGKVKEVAEDVHSYSFTPDGQLLYLYDYSTSSCRGDLALYNGRKSEKIDEDVVALIPIYHRDFFFWMNYYYWNRG